MNNHLIDFFGTNREFFIVHVPEAFSKKCFTCTSCNQNCTEGKFVQKQITCMKCVYPGNPMCCN